MANLIPPEAKKEVIISYWMRVFTVWFVLIGLAFVVISLLKLPTFVLVHSQLRAFSSEYNEAIDKSNQFEALQKEIVDANELSDHLLTNVTEDRFIELIRLIDTIGGADIYVKDFQFVKTENGLENITVSGTSNTRVALANFSKGIEEDSRFLKAELPISNLAKDRDIGFTIDIKVAVDEI